jgi:1,2-phenylacetyl-CoA epoxidase PaaB subunit
VDRKPTHDHIYDLITGDQMVIGANHGNVSTNHAAEELALAISNNAALVGRRSDGDGWAVIPAAAIVAVTVRRRRDPDDPTVDHHDEYTYVHGSGDVLSSVAGADQLGEPTPAQT